VIADQIRRDPEQPGLEATAVLIVADRPHEAEKRLLKQLLGNLARPGEPVKQPEDAWCEELDQSLEGGRLAAARTAQQALQAGGIQSDLS